MSDPLRVLLTNDDGVDAPGLFALRSAFASRPDIEIYVAAPDRERSTCSHGMTLLKPVTATEISPYVFAVDGLPADCVYLAGNGLFPAVPHLVISGINRGANLGSDVIFSGTVAAARQAALQGMHGIATSLIEGDDFEVAATMTADIARRLAMLPPFPPVLLNLNFPAGKPAALRFGALGQRHYPQMVTVRQSSASGRTAYQLGGPDVEDALIPDTDGWLVSRNIASATLLSIDQTDMKRMKDAIFALDLEGIAPW